MTPEEIARVYFARMRAGERVDDMFTDDAELRGFGDCVTGKAAIAEMYAGVGRPCTSSTSSSSRTTSSRR